MRKSAFSAAALSTDGGLTYGPLIEPHGVGPRIEPGPGGGSRVNAAIAAHQAPSYGPLIEPHG